MPKQNFVAVVDDDELFRVALVDALSSLRYGVRGFSSAEQFIAEDAQKSCDCVITDIHMPGMSGLDLKTTLAAKNSKVPVIMITARAEPELEAKVLASGAICLLRKPFESKALIACLETALKVR